MPSKQRARQGSPSLGSSELIVSAQKSAGIRGFDVELIVKLDGMTFAWEHFHISPGPEKPLWPAEFLVHLTAWTGWFADLAGAEVAERDFLRSFRPKFDFIGAQEVLPF
jgi:hypothetical protein